MGAETVGRIEAAGPSLEQSGPSALARARRRGDHRWRSRLPLGGLSRAVRLVGDGDPQDPPANLSGIAAQQPNSLIAVMSAQEHVVGHLGCGPSVVAACLDAGTTTGLNITCLSAPADPALTFPLEQVLRRQSTDDGREQDPGDPR